MTQTDFSS